MITCKITLPDSPQPILLVKIPDSGHFISLDGMNFIFFSFSTYKNILFYFFLLASARKIMALPELGGLQPPSPLARTPMSIPTHFSSTMYTGSGRQTLSTDKNQKNGGRK